MALTITAILVWIITESQSDYESTPIEPPQYVISQLDTGWTKVRLSSRQPIHYFNSSLTVSWTPPSFPSEAEQTTRLISSVQSRIFTSRKPLKSLPLKIQLNSSTMHERMKSDSITGKFPNHAPVKNLKLVYEIKPTDKDKISSLLQRNSSILLVKNSGKLMALREESWEESEVHDMKIPLKKVQFFPNGWMAAIETNSSVLSIFDWKAKVRRQLQLPYVPKDMNTLIDKVGLGFTSIFVSNHISKFLDIHIKWIKRRNLRV